MSKIKTNSKIDVEKIKYWRSVILDYEKSGLSKSKYCNENNITHSSFYKWCRRYEAGNLELPPEHYNRVKHSPGSVKFIPVDVDRATPEHNSVYKPKTKPRSSQLSLSAYKIKLPNGIELELPDNDVGPKSLKLLNFLMEVC